MKSQFLILFAALLTLTVSCNKDDDNAANPLENANNKYTFQGNTIAITGAEYYYADGDTYLYFKGTGVSDYVYFTFADIDGAIPTGAFTFHADRYSGYIPGSNFWGASVLNEEVPLGIHTTGGSIIITSQPDGAYKITFTFVTPSGDVVGEYNGFLLPRP
ncbi:MAG TPA: hypothetical protein VK528_09015 [Flavobacterium sp.]|nr:hypothetical protein [Flavobacterium sp.]